MRNKWHTSCRKKIINVDLKINTQKAYVMEWWNRQIKMKFNKYLHEDKILVHTCQEGHHKVQYWNNVVELLLNLIRKRLWLVAPRREVINHIVNALKFPSTLTRWGILWPNCSLWATFKEVQNNLFTSTRHLFNVHRLTCRCSMFHYVCKVLLQESIKRYVSQKWTFLLLVILIVGNSNIKTHEH